MKTEQVTCDQCGADITYHQSSYPAEWIITLRAETKPRPPDYKGGLVYAVISYPPLGRTLHFCRLGCLDDYRAAANGAARARGTAE